MRQKTLRDSLYDVEVVESNPANQKLKIHYRGYSSRYGEWRSVSEVVHKLAPVVWTHDVMITYSLLLYLDLYHEIVVSPHVE